MSDGRLERYTYVSVVKNTAIGKRYESQMKI